VHTQVDATTTVSAEPTWKAGSGGATVWQLPAAVFAQLRASNAAVDTAFAHYVASQLRERLGAVLRRSAPSASSASSGAPPGARPVVRIFDSQQYQYTFFEEINADPKFGYQLEPLNVRLSETTVNLAAGAYVCTARAHVCACVRICTG
jgi:hypothetical protein